METFQGRGRATVIGIGCNRILLFFLTAAALHTPPPYTDPSFFFIRLSHFFSSSPAGLPACLPLSLSLLSFLFDLIGFLLSIGFIFWMETVGVDAFDAA